MGRLEELTVQHFLWTRVQGMLHVDGTSSIESVEEVFRQLGAAFVVPAVDS